MPSAVLPDAAREQAYRLLWERLLRPIPDPEPEPDEQDDDEAAQRTRNPQLVGDQGTGGIADEALN